MTRFASLTTVLLLFGAVLVQGAQQKKPNNPPARPKAKKRARAVPPQRRGFAILGSSAFFRRQNKLYLLRVPKVQAELKLDEDQKVEINDAVKSIAKMRTGIYQKLRQLQPLERVKKNRELQQKIATEAERKVKGILEPKQLARLDQILLQLEGLPALRDPRVVKKLKITEEQQQKFKDVNLKVLKQRSRVVRDFRNGKLERAKYQEKLGELNKDLEKKTLEVLDKQQRAEFDKMKGRKFELPRRRVGVVGGAIRLNRANIKRIRIKAKPVRPQKAQKKNPAGKSEKKKDADK